MNAAEGVLMRAIAEQAQAWFITNREHDLSTEKRREFLAWLQVSPVHVREYLAVAKLAVDLRAVAQTVDTPTQELVAAALNEPADNIVALDARPPPPQSSPGPEYQPRAAAFRVRRVAVLAAAIGTLAVGGVSWWGVRQMSQYTDQYTDYRTARGEQRTVRLEDGSVLHLNIDSVALVAYKKAERRVEVQRGQVLFKVIKDNQRPFRVIAGVTEVIAVGTSFDVRRTRDDVVVTVVTGVVDVKKLAGSQSNVAGAEGVEEPVRLTAGQQARVAIEAVNGVKPVNVHQVDVRRAVSWVQQMIMFDRESLGSVAAEFNRYGMTQLTIEDPRAAALRITGVFNAYDVDSFVLYLENVKGLQVHRDMQEVRISLARPVTTGQ